MLLGEEQDRQVTVHLAELDIPHHDLSGLDSLFTEEEVWKTICSLPSDKAPGPDGFTCHFYKTCWSVIKADVMAAVSAIWSRKFGRFTQDNFMLVQQVARYLHQQKQARILVKLDITKAFDSVSWPFLLEVLSRMGFGQIWCDIISGLLSSSSTQVMLNGIPGEKISYWRGLRQGDPLSPICYSF
jgi:hypothetical protein